MWELTAENTEEYLRRAGRLTAAEPLRVEVLAGGVSNVVLRVEQGGRRYVLKQSRPQLRTRMAWFSDVERIYREQQAMELLEPLLPASVIPRVLFSDPPHFVLAMEHAPVDARPWKELLLAGQADTDVARQAGCILGRMHESTAAQRDRLTPLADRTIFVQLRVDPFYRCIQRVHADLAAAIEPLVGDLMTRDDALCHGDYSPKNLLVHAGGIVLVDHETAHRGEPAMDVGFFFSHLLLKTLRAAPDWQRYRAVVGAAEEGYRATAAAAAEATLRRAVGHLAVCLLTRLDGTSPVDYLADEPRRQAARRYARGLLLEPPADWAEALQRLEQEAEGVA